MYKRFSFDIPPTICAGCNRYGIMERDFLMKNKK